LFIPWSKLKPTYRGKPKDDAEPLKLGSVKRWSIMNRRYVNVMLVSRCMLMMNSFFGEQEGDFSLTIKSIKAVSQSSEDLESGVVSGSNVRRALL
jgi:hypothetical protein|tara:strand:- start:7745 stop:8029 length:285 start_codon:yes stop_codon:yes gene_type:complete